jgi:hypothetical protein
MKNIFHFGEKVKEYDVRVLNEREVRAAAGILFVFALISFMHIWLVWDFQLIKIFIIVFLIDFLIRLFVNPKFAPTMIIGRLIVSKQKVEYTGAPQKKFAWRMGLVLSLIMFFLMIVQNIKGPLNFAICLICLIFLFFESSFGICLGCQIYNLFHKEKAQLCPGGTCEVFEKKEIQKVSKIQIIILILFIFLTIGLFKFYPIQVNNENLDNVKDCLSGNKGTYQSSCGCQQ